MRLDRTIAMLAMLLACLCVSPADAQPQTAAAGPALLVLSYHDIRDDVAERGDPDQYATSTQNFAAHLDWLAGHGYHPVSMEQVVQAAHGGAVLPDKPVLLTFDDGLRSLYTRAFPLLRAYGYPALAAVVTSWVDMPAGQTMDYGPRPFGHDDFVTWAQLREMQDSGLVEVASHSNALHNGIPSNPQGNSQPAAITRLYDPATGRYEDEQAYVARVRADLARSAGQIRSHLGRAPRAVVWPYAAYNGVTNKLADELGMPITFDLEGRSSPLQSDLHGLSRNLVQSNPGVGDLARDLRMQQRDDGIRALQVDLDGVYDPDPAQLERNLDVLVERVKRIKPSHVFLQAFADPDGNGSADALYFPNHYLPMRADLFNRVAWQLRTRAEVKVYAWLPVLGYELPDAAQREALRLRGGAHDDTFRLDFSKPQVRTIIRGIYTDLGVSAYFEGLLFHDDAYLRDTELVGLGQNDPGQRTRALIDFTSELTAAAGQWRPKLKTVRNLFAEPVLHPESEAWWAQRLDLFNQAYTYTAVMAMPWMEGARQPERWLDGLVAAVRQSDPRMDHTLFELQTVDWNTKKPIPPERLKAQVRRLLAAGVRHVAWYPDDFIGNVPSMEDAREGISARDFPYQER